MSSVSLASVGRAIDVKSSGAIHLPAPPKCVPIVPRISKELYPKVRKSNMEFIVDPNVSLVSNQS